MFSVYTKGDIVKKFKRKKTIIYVIAVMIIMIIGISTYLCFNVIPKQNMISNTENIILLVMNAFNGISTDEFSDLDTQNEKHTEYFRKHGLPFATEQGVDSVLVKWWTIAPSDNSKYGMKIEHIVVTPTTKSEAVFYANLVVQNEQKNPIRTIVVKGKIRTNNTLQNKLDYFAFDAFSHAELSQIRMESENK